MQVIATTSSPRSTTITAAAANHSKLLWANSFAWVNFNFTIVATTTTTMGYYSEYDLSCCSALVESGQWLSY